MNAPPTDRRVTDFVETARLTCAAIESFDGKHANPLLSALTGLLDAAEAVRDDGIDVDDLEMCIERIAPPPFLAFSQDLMFHVVFDPLDPTSVVAVSFKDCLTDIYCSLKGGLRVLDHSPEKKMAVIWEWRNNYQFHWGRHLIDTIRYLMLSSKVA